MQKQMQSIKRIHNTEIQSQHSTNLVHLLPFNTTPNPDCGWGEDALPPMRMSDSVPRQACGPFSGPSNDFLEDLSLMLDNQKCFK